MYLGENESRRPKNSAEAKLYDEMAGAGWEITKRGWPDFFCIREKDGQTEVCVVEVKPHSGAGLKNSQAVVMQTLAAYGVPCFMYSPDGGLRRIMPGEKPPTSRGVDESQATGDEHEDDRRLASAILDLPHIGTVTEDALKTARVLLELYAEDYGSDWVFSVIHEVHAWCEQKRGNRKLTGKRDGHRFLSGWFRRAMKWHNPRKQIDGESYEDVGF